MKKHFTHDFVEFHHICFLLLGARLQLSPTIVPFIRKWRVISEGSVRFISFNIEEKNVNKQLLEYNL